MRTGWFRRAHIKTKSCYRLRLLLTQRRNLKRKVLDLENTIRHSLKAFGIRIKGTGRTGFDKAVREAVADTSIDVQGRISKAGDPDVRRALYEAASALMTRFKGRDKVRTWGLALARRSCHRKATVAVARKLAVIMHAMWTDGTCYVGDAAASASDLAARAAVKDSKLLGAQA